MVSPRARRWLRFGVSAAALAVILRFIPIRQLVTTLADVPASVLLSTLAVLLAGHVAGALKWRMLQGGQTGLSVATALKAQFYGVMANVWLPGVVGGDVVRAGVGFRQSTRPTLVVLASLIDRIVDSVGLLALTAAGLLVAGAPSRGAWTLLEAGVCAAVVGALALAGCYRFLKTRRRTRRLTELVEAVDLMVKRPGLVAAAFAISLATQTAFILVNVNLGRAVGMAAPVSAWFMAWPLAKLAALIPISAAGLGVREAALIALMRPFGDPPSAVMAAGLLWQAVFIVGGALGGGFFFLFPDRTEPRDESLPGVAQEW